MRYIVFATPKGDGCRITWTQIITGLNDQGNAYVAQLEDGAFAAMIEAAGKMLSAYLDTGERLSISLPEEIRR